MKIDAFITCVGENARKFLAVSLGFNKKLFDNVYVITTEKSTETHELCARAGVECVTTDLFYKNHAVFNRGAALNDVFDLIKPADWVCHLDADIILPSTFLEWKNNYNDSIEYFWGCRRIFIPAIYDLSDLMTGKVIEDVFEKPYGIGYGYMQLWNVNSEVVKSGAKYPESYDSSNSDWQWRNFWGETINGDKEYTKNLKELPISCLHLGLPGLDNNQSFWGE